MKEAVSDILEARAKDTGGVNRAIAWSIGVHVLLVTVLIVVPRSWLFAHTPPPKMMTINLGGALGNKPTGVTPIGARAVEKATPEPKRPEPVKPAVPKVESVSIPIKSAAKPKVDPEPDQVSTAIPITRAPTTGREVTQGTAVAETGAKGQGTGLSGGTAAGASSLGLPDDFCCMAYASSVVAAIDRNWLEKARPERGETQMQFTIKADGTIVDVKILKKSGILALDQASQNIFKGLLLAPLPAEYKEPTLTIRLTFKYGS